MKFRQISLDGHPIDVYTLNGSWQPAPEGMPPEVAANGEVWRVTFHTSIYSARSKGSRLAGCALPLERAIILDPSVPMHEMRSTLGHEIAHVIIGQHKQRGKALRRLTSEQEEILCDLLADHVARGVR